MKRIGVRPARTDITAIETALPSVTFEQATRLFCDVKRAQNLKPKTMKGYESNIRYFHEWLEENHQELGVRDIGASTIREYMLWCANEKIQYDDHPLKGNEENKQGLSPASVNVRLRALKVFFNTLFEEEVINKNPAANIKLMKTEEDTVQPLTEEEIRKLLDSLDTNYYHYFRDYILILLMLDTGMRLNEACSLEVKEVDLVARQIVLPASKNKNRKTRVLPLSTETNRLLLQLITENKGYFNTEYVFVTNTGDKLDEKTVQWAFTKYAKKAGIERRFSPHVLRHNFAKMCALNGMDIFTLMRIMGHADISTTRKYVQVSDEDVREKHNMYSPLQKIIKRK